MAPQQPGYRIAYHRVVRRQLQACLDELRVAGWDKDVLVQILKEAERRLQTDPASCGEPLFTLRGTDMIVTVFCLRPFSFHFAIQESTRTIVVREISVMTLKEL